MVDLSIQQQNILKWLLGQTRLAEERRPDLLEGGFVWALRCNNKANENSIRASYSRALARLERRGLVVRIKGRKEVRTVRVRLSPTGRRVAERLSG
jgi:hypothetical protein